MYEVFFNDPSMYFNIIGYVKEKILLVKCLESVSFSRQIFLSVARKTGESMFCHSYRMFQKSVSYGVYDEVILHSIFLHDVVEDSAYQLADIEKKFGKHVAFVVEGMTCVDHQKHKIPKQEYFDKFAFYCVMERRMLVVKMLDCIDNLETLSGLTPEKRKKFVQEKNDVFLPIFEKHSLQIPIELSKNYQIILQDFKAILYKHYE